MPDTVDAFLLHHITWSVNSVCHFVGFSAASLDFLLRFWINDPANGVVNVKGEVYLALWEAFREHGIEIPFPQREVRLLQDAA